MQPEELASKSIDSLSAIGRQLLRLDASSAYTRLVVTSPGNEAARSMLESLSPRDLVDGKVTSEEDANAVLSALWLRHDWLGQSHEISQGIKNRTGSMWHAIMHRREGDFSNAKYWYDRVSDHPIYATLAVRAGDVINPYPADKSVFRITFNGWDPNALVDLVQQVHQKPQDPRHRIATMLQELEFQTLFEHTTRASTAV